MKEVTVTMSDNLATEVETMLAEGEIQNLEAFVSQAIGFYIFIWRQVRGGALLAILDKQLEINGNLIDWSSFLKLFANHEKAKPKTSS